MANVKISQLPAVPSSLLTDVFPVDQGLTTYQATLQQVLTLFNPNIQLASPSQVTGLGQAAVKNVSNNLKPNVASVFGATVANNIAIFSDTTGTVEDSGHALSEYARLNGAIFTGTVTLNGSQANPNDAATIAYVNSQTGSFLPLAGGTMSGIINMGNHKITNLTDPSSAQDAVTINYLNSQLANYLALSGGTMTGAINMGSHKITSLLDPTNPQDAATKNYVDTVAVGFTVKAACSVATTANLTATYSNGASGIGATLTNSGALAALTIDGVSVNTNDRVLVKNQSSTFQNGIYTVTNVGSGAVAWVLTRATDFDQPSEIQPGDLVVINNGTVNAGTSWLQTASVASIGTDAILFSQFTFSATAVLLKANNLSDVANTTTSFNNISPLTTKGDLIGYSTQNVRLAVGGTNGQILQVSSGAATGLAWSTAAYPSTTTQNQILYSSATNTVTGISTTAGGVLVTDLSSVPQFLANPSATGKILQSVSGAIPAWSTPTYPSASGTSGKFLISDGTNNVYSTSTIPTSAGATANKVLLSDGTNYVLSTPTFPNASATSGKFIISDGTNWIASTNIIPNTATQGDIIYASAANTFSTLAKNTSSTRYLSNTGTSNNPAWAQVDLSNGVTGNLPVGNLNSGTSASSTTFWRGDGSWATPTGTGAMNYLSTGTASGSATVALTGLTGYTNYLILVNNLQPATNNTNLYLRTSTNNGVSYDSGTNYRFQTFTTTSTSTGAGYTNGATQMTMAGAVYNGSTNSGSGWIYIYSPANGNYTNIHSYFGYVDQAASAMRSYQTFGQYAQSTTVNAVEFFMSSGNMTTGTFILYGLQ